MATLMLNEGDALWTIPGGDKKTTIHGTSGTGTVGVDKIAITSGANVELKGFNAGNDVIYIQDNSTDFSVRKYGATVYLTDGDDTIQIAAGTTGQNLIFGNGYLSLKISGGQIMLGSQTIGDTNVALSSAVDASQTWNDQFHQSTTVTIDTGTITSPVQLSAATGAFTFTDNATVTTNVVIAGFGSDDRITTTAQTSAYTITNNGPDVTISFNNAGTLNQIVLTNAVSASALIFDEASFEAAVGFNAFTGAGGTATPGTLTYGATMLNEAAANNGTITETIAVTLSGDTFAADLTGDYTFTGVPAGMTGTFTRVSSTTGTISLTGAALAHANANDTKAGITFGAAAFTSSLAATGASQAIGIDFDDPAGYTEVCADLGTATAPATLDAGTGAIYFTDNATIENNVVIAHFAQDDKIVVSQASASNYSFSNNGADVVIACNNAGTMNIITLMGVVDAGALIYDESSFESTLGFDAFTVV